MGLDIFHVVPSPRNENLLKDWMYIQIKSFQSNPDFLKKYEYFITDSGYGDKVICCMEKGYLQGWRVTQKFTKEFENNKLYFSSDDVKNAKHFLKAIPGENQAELEITFQENFIDNFIEGESIFLISY